MSKSPQNPSDNSPIEKVVVQDSQSLPRRVLVAEDDTPKRKQLKESLEKEPNVTVETVADGQSAIEKLQQHDYSVVVTDLDLPRMDGVELTKEVKNQDLSVTVVAKTDNKNADGAIEALRHGAYECLTTPVETDEVREVVHQALADRFRTDQVQELRNQLQDRYSFHDLLSKNPRMHGIFELIANVAHSMTTVLIQGETGTGKELVARAIHQLSRDRKGPLVAINCAALPETLLESELFGHEKGAFTSADKARQGRFELAHGGTLFLDEVGDIPPSMQAKLLRVLQECRFERVGGSETVDVDVRVIAATNRSLKKLVKKGQFRADLYYRLNVVKISLPPLRRRPEDIPLLATLFAQRYAPDGEAPKKIAPAAMEVLLNHRWPGNVRELENAIERACVTCNGAEIKKENLPLEMASPEAKKIDALRVSLKQPLPDLMAEVTAEIEESYLRKALKKAGGHVGRCAEICGLSRRAVTAKIAEHNINKAEYKHI